jgi:hypothetical protein
MLPLKFLDLFHTILKQKSNTQSLYAHLTLLSLNNPQLNLHQLTSIQKLPLHTFNLPAIVIKSLYEVQNYLIKHPLTQQLHPYYLDITDQEDDAMQRLIKDSSISASEVHTMSDADIDKAFKQLGLFKKQVFSDVILQDIYGEHLLHIALNDWTVKRFVAASADQILVLGNIKQLELKYMIALQKDLSQQMRNYQLCFFECNDCLPLTQELILHDFF